MYKLLRWGSGRMLAFSVIVISLLLCLYYVSQTQQAPSTGAGSAAALLGPEGPRYDSTGGGSSPGAAKLTTILAQYNEPPADVGMATDTCPLIIPRTADINAQEQFKEFDFEPSWVRSREYWDDSFEARYVELRKDPTRPPLKVILMPHSHTDPGWLKTFEQYYHSSTRGILNNMVTKLQQWSNMTFIWSEVSFLSMWWESAHPTKKMVVKRLVKEGRLEMTTGGWVMTDEASSHIYAMLDQLIEGHQWLKTNLDVTPEYGWAVDPFGHGGTVPYLLKKSGASGTIIQRIHYAWKQWFAKKQCGDFVWLQPWDKSGASDMLTHNQPFDIYNIKHSCGPHPHVCLNFDFRKIRGEYTEYSVRAVDITSNNVKQMAELLLEQFSRTGSLFTHNVVLMPLGDDFRYDHPIEWDQQYTNYKILVDYINSHKDEYNAEIVFGTPKDYFREIENRVEKFPTLKGDFFVYSDIFSEGRPAYWSGYFTTRPYMKILDRELEASLRSAEILYTIALNVAKRSGNDIKLYETHFEKLVKARRNLGLFQHHDAITGTSKSFVMKDYAQKLFESIVDMTSLQSFAVQTLTAITNNKPNTVYVLPESDRDSYEKLPKKIPIMVTNQETRKILLFNPLAQARQEIVRLKVTTYKVRILDPQKNPIPYQITPVMNATSITHDVYVVLFVADLKPLAIATYHIEQIERIPMDAISTVHCNGCGKDTVFPIKAMLLGDIQLENKRMKLVFDGQTGFLKRVTKKSTGKIMQCAIQFAAYASAQFHSGAYLFMPDPTQRETDKDILDGSGSRPKIYIVSGRLSARLTVEYGKLLSHHVSIYLQEGGLAEAIYVRNVIDFETPPKNRETEMFMRLQTDISNGEPAVFYTDLNGHQMIKRTKVESIGIEGNYFPITSMAYIEDDSHRLTLLVNHGQGAASYQPGWLEVMLDRRTLYDDSRGMGEGLLDNRRTVMKHWILLEDANGPAADDDYSKPSLFANHLSNALNYPVNIFVVDATEDEVTLSPETKLITQSFPCDLHLMNLRTNHDQKLPDFPINSALMVLHRQGYSCSVGANPSMEHCPLSDRLHPATSFFKLDRLNVTKTSLTGTKHKEHLKKGLREIAIQPMEIETYNVQFLH